MDCNSGFFEITLDNGDLMYTRVGSFQVNSDGYMTTKDGFQLASSILVPPDATAINIAEDGTVSAIIAGTNEEYEIGQIEVATFLSEGRLKPLGNGLFLSTEEYLSL